MCSGVRRWISSTPRSRATGASIDERTVLQDEREREFSPLLSLSLSLSLSLNAKLKITTCIRLRKSLPSHLDNGTVLFKLSPVTSFSLHKEEATLQTRLLHPCIIFFLPLHLHIHRGNTWGTSEHKTSLSCNPLLSIACTLMFAPHFAPDERNDN